MREVVLTDAELQKLIAPALRARLLAGGLRGGACSAACGSAFFPINLDLAGSCTVERTEDGIWTFRQEVDEIAGDRTAHAHEAHAAAVSSRLGSQS